MCQVKGRIEEGKENGQTLQAKQQSWANCYVLDHPESSAGFFIINLKKDVQKDKEFLLNHINTVLLCDIFSITLAAEKFSFKKGY